MAVDEAEVRDALRAVSHPVGGRSIVELGMLGPLSLRRGRVGITLLVNEADAGVREELAERVREAVGALGGVREVRVELRVVASVDDAPGRGPGEPSGGPSGPAAGPPKPRESRRPGGGGRQVPLGHEDGRANAFARPGSRTRVIGVTSGKGGVGKSSVTVNLAVALVRAGFDVGLLDADVYGFSVPAMLGIDSSPTMSSDKMVPPVAYGVRTMSIGYFVDEDQPVMWRGPMLHKALEQFLVDVDWGDPDFLLVDMPPGTGDVALSMAQYLPTSEVYVVTTPQPAAKRVAQRTAYMARKINLPLRGVIENMSWFTGADGTRYELFGRGGGEELARELGVPLLARVPLVPALREGGDTGCPVVVADPRGEAASAFGALAQAVVARGPSRIFRPELTIS
ncbi:MAG: Mrp/NBP35 family ATP-binding protein [Actinomycetota bacterium]|nr:Mrp/NBP35 family ATP-binding protein [Actinomycetota bacterium]